jgi:Uma2 family endonuclease
MVYAERTTWSAAELAALPDDGYHYELVKGRLIQMPPAAADHGETSGDLGTELGLYARTHGGHSYAAETGFNLTLPGEAEETILSPDAAYIRDEVVPKDRHGFVGRAPDLAVEIASPSQFRAEMEGKVHLWLARGCRLVWLVWPRYKTIEVWHPGDTVPRQTLRPGDELDGGEILPDLHYPVARAFPQA